MTAFLTGSSADFAVHVEFEAYPEIAGFAAEALKSTPRELTSTGYRLDSTDINGKLAEAEDPPISSLEDARALFTPAGRIVSIDDLRGQGDDPATPLAADGTIDDSEAGAFALDAFRSIAGPVSSRGLLLGAIAVLLTTLLVAFIGGRQWWSRAVWGASAFAAASFVIVLVAGPVYGATLAPVLADSVSEAKVELIASDNAATSLGLRALDQVETVINQQVAAVGTNALVIGIVALLLAAAAVATHVYLDRRAATSEEPSVPYAFEDATKPLDEDEDTEEQAAA